jgi:myo-inositol 2-dehydrogenase/D-chiro-inositol 1-dehydrogenase
MRVGVIGSGTMGARHIGAWTALGAEILLYSPTAPRRADLASRSAATAVDSLDQLLESVDLVDICTPTDTHRELTEHSARAGRHVVCEKPLARRVEDAEAMLEVCAAAGVALFAAHVLRYFPAYANARRAVAAGEIGAPRALRLSRAVDWPDDAPWLLDTARSGGVLLDLMIHDLDYARWVAGEVVRVEAGCERGDRIARGWAILTHESGAVSDVRGAWGTYFQSVFDIDGTDGTLGWDAATAPAGDGPEDAPYRSQLADFAAAIRLGSAARVTAADGLAALRIALAAVESHRTGRSVELAG